jgi:hypothetical protein
MSKLPTRRSSATEINQFLQKSRSISTFVKKQPRLLFAIDATASRQPTWDTACHLQQEMFRETDKIGSLAVQLAYYRGFHEFFASAWHTESATLKTQMSTVDCRGGQTQIKRLLRHALEENSKTPIRALVFIGDAMEESADALCDLAGQCGLQALPLFLFQEGRHAHVERCFRDMARLSGGAFAHFDSSSADTLAALLGAVAKYVAGGRKALENTSRDSDKLLLQQLKH